MSDSQNSGFGKFVPGFDFLQNLAKGAAQNIPQMPNLANWVAPTLNVEELEKRIDELKSVQFWLDQNAMALKATIQALEVQKMTLATLKGMNFNMGDVANAFKLKAADSVMTSVQKVAEKASDSAKSFTDVATGAMARATGGRKTAGKADGATGVVDPMQWWGALTQQFQQIAASALKEATTKTAIDSTRNLATSFAKGAMKGAGSMAKAAVGKSAAPAKRAPAKKAARKRAA